MVSKAYFVRIRGRVQGPFAVEKLRTLVRRGQVSRTHEVSEDGVSWSRAVDFAELFEAPTQVSIRESAEDAASKSAPQQESPPSEKIPSSGPEDAWHYAVGASQKGPVNRATLQHLIQIEQLPPETEVWSTGMENWQPANTIPGLVPESKSTQKRKRQKQRTPVSDDIHSARGLAPLLKSMRLWTMLIAIVGLVLCLIQLMRGIIDIAANHGVWGLGLLTATFIQGTAYALLLTFAIRVGKYLEDRTELRLITAMRAMRTFWMYVGTLLCILLALLLVGISLMLAGIDLMTNAPRW